MADVKIGTADYVLACQAGDLRAAAQALIDMGQRPVLLRTDNTGSCKVPFDGGAWGRRLVAKRMETLERSIKRGLLGLGLGFQPTGNLAVLDLDCPDKDRDRLPEVLAGAVELLFGGEVPETFEVHGKGGSHLWFTISDNLRDKWAEMGLGKKKIELATGGAVEVFMPTPDGQGQYQVATAPSAGKSIGAIRPIQPMPASLEEYLIQTYCSVTGSVEAAGLFKAGITSAARERFFEATIRQAITKISNAPKGTQHDTIRNWGMMLAGYAVSLGQVHRRVECHEEAMRAAKAAGASENRASRTWDDGWEFGLNKPARLDHTKIAAFESARVEPIHIKTGKNKKIKRDANRAENDAGEAFGDRTDNQGDEGSLGSCEGAGGLEEALSVLRALANTLRADKQIWWHVKQAVASKYGQEIADQVVELLRAELAIEHPEKGDKDKAGHRWTWKRFVKEARENGYKPAAGGRDDGDDEDLIPVFNDDKNFHQTISNVVEVLSNEPGLYIRQFQLVEVEKVTTGKDAGKLEIRELTAERLATLFSRHGWLYTLKNDDGNPVRVPVRPPAVMKEVLGQRQFPQIRPLIGVQEAPYFHDGRFVNTAGYDHQSGLLLDGKTMERAPVIGEVTEDQARLAAAFIEETLGVLGYEDDTRQGCWNIASITMSLQTRWLHTIRPANLVTAPERGSGKTEATDLAIKAALSRESIGSLRYVENKTLELEVFSHAGSGGSYLYFDDMADGTGFGCHTLNRLITAGTISGRPYHQNSKIEERQADFVIVANGNNIQSSADMARRCLMTKLVKSADTGGERFRDRFTERRSDFARACATVVAWHIQNDCPRPGGPVLAPENFGDWAKVVRDAIWHASKLTGPPVDIMQGAATMARNDDKMEESSTTLLAVLKYWANTPLSQWERIRRAPFSAAQIAEDMLDIDKNEHVRPLAGVIGVNANAMRVGRVLGRYKDHKVVHEGVTYRLEADRSDKQVRQWKFAVLG